jgi:type III pantothenate kinase
VASSVEEGGLTAGGICSVVPSETADFTEAMSSTFGVEVRRIEGTSECGIAVTTDNPPEVGGDRVANAVGAYYGYGGPAIVVDVGTAMTFDYISQDGEYRGGVIAPGILAGARDLWHSARMLPDVEITKPSKVIGTTTIECMQSGILYGALGGVESIVRRMWEEIGRECRVILTGGQADLLRAELTIEMVSDPYLTLKGIAYCVDEGLRR